MTTSPPEPQTDTELKKPSWIGRVQRIGFLELFEKYRQRMVNRDTGLPFDPTKPNDAPYTIERLAFETGSGLRVLLKIFFPFCALMFLVSFAWDFEVRLIRSCSVAGMIGFGTNWVAIKMLFWPREVRPVFGQGLIPSQRDQLIAKVADEVVENLINEELISRKIEEIQLVRRFSQAIIQKLRQVVREDEFQQDLRNMILTYVGDVASDARFRERLTQRAEKSLEEFTGSNFKGWVIKRLKRTWRPPLIEVLNREIEVMEETVTGALEGLDAIMDRAPQALEQRQEAIDHVLTTMLLGIVREVDVREIVLEQLSTVTPEQLEREFRAFSDDKLSFITLLGGLLGLVGGTVLVWPLRSMAVILALGAILVLVDVAIRPLMASRYWPKKSRPRQTSGSDSAS